MIEDVTNRIKSLIETNLDEYLAIQDAQYSDSITTQKVRSILIADETIGSYGMPAIVIDPVGTDQVEYSCGKKDMDYTIDIGVLVDKSSELISTKCLWRTMRALESMLEALMPQDQIIWYQTQNIDFKNSVLEVDESNSTAKGGTITGIVRERLTSYTERQA